MPSIASARSGSRRAIDRWAAASLAAAALVGLPLLALPLSFLRPGAAWEHLAAEVLPSALLNSALLAVAVGAGALVLGTALAVLVSFYEFPGRRTLEWALVLPLAMPGYVLTFVLLGQYDRFAVGSLPDLRSPGGTFAVLTAVLYPYVYLLGRAAFLTQSRSLFEAARTLGVSYHGAIRRVALPLARPALAGGSALAMMEALADFGTVNLLGYDTLTNEIYRVWFGAFDRRAALQLGTALLGVVLLLVAVERVGRRRRSYQQQAGPGQRIARRRLRPVPAALALGLPLLLLTTIVAGPLAQLAVWSAQALSEGAFGAGLLAHLRNSLLLAFLAATVAVALATVMAYGLRVAPSLAGRSAARFASLGYALPGSVVAVAVFIPLAWVDRRIADAGERVFGARPGLLITGSILALLIAYLARFIALAFHTTEAQMLRIPARLDDAARALGADRSRVLAEVHAPLLWPGVLTAALLVFVEVMKELPATVLLRPLGMETLSIAVWEATRESLYETGAFPALLIVAAGLVPVVVLMRLIDATASGERRAA
jgi:iron(III) transport system permease protein